MIRILPARFAAALTAASLLTAPLAAYAQDNTDGARRAPPPAAPMSAQAPNGVFVAALQQQTQLTYVPQSVALSGPRVIQDWDEDSGTVPNGYHTESRIRRGLVVGGAVTFGVMYLLTAFGASVANDLGGGANALYVPVLGPFIQMTNSDSSSGKFLLAIDGAAQAAGAAMLIYGIASPKTVLVRNDLGMTTHIVPMRMGNGGSGVGLMGTF